MKTAPKVPRIPIDEDSEDESLHGSESLDDEEQSVSLDGTEEGDSEGEAEEDMLLSSDELDERLGIKDTPGLEAGPRGVDKEEHVKKNEESKPKARKRKADPSDVDGGGERSLAQKVLSKKRMLHLKEKADRRGVVYISRIPPHMKPGKIRQLLSAHGELGRLYCAPEDASARRDRKKQGKDTGKNFTEGWVEFEDKRVAKRVAEQLNGQPIGGKKRSAYYFDLWCLKYLSKFKWDHLTEEINYQRAVREQRLAVEISAAKRERDFYLSRVDRSKAMEAIKERKRLKLEKSQGEAAGGAGDAAAVPPPSGAAPPRMRHFKQRRTKAYGGDADAPEMDGDVLSLVGGRN